MSKKVEITDEKLIEKLEEGNVFYDKKLGEIFIPFNKYMGIDFDLEYMRFSLSDKIVYKNLSKRLVENIDLFMNINHDIKWHYMYLKSKIIENIGNYPEDEFVDDVLNIFEDSIVDDIKTHIDTLYKIDLDAKSKKSKNRNEELQLTNHHGEVLQYSAFAQRLIIPILTDYIEYNYDKRSKRKSYFKVDEAMIMDVSTKIIMLFDNNSQNMLNKLYRFIGSRITSTKSSDAVIWNYLRNLSKNLTTETSELYRKMIVSVLPKLKEERDVVSFIHSVSGYSLRHLFTSNYSISYSPVDINRVDKDDLTEFEKISINMVKHDEFYSNLIQATIPHEINNLKEMYGIRITKEELAYYSKYLDINNVQKEIVFYIMAKYFGGLRVLYSMNHQQYVELCLLTSKILKNKGFSIIPSIITANPVNSKSGRRKLSRNKEFLSQLAASRKFERIHKDIFSHIEQKLYETKEFLKLVATINNTKFISIEEEEQVDINSIFLTDEVMDLLMII